MYEAALGHEPVGFMSNVLKNIDLLHPSIVARQVSMFYVNPQLYKVPKTLKSLKF